jgi:glycosyltransferase involved in cell wall biosynthesis
MKILLLSKYGSLGSSSRLRFYQFIPYLRNAGIEVQVEALLDNRYVQSLYANEHQNAPAILFSYFKRFFYLLKSKTYNLIWIEKEAFPWLPAWTEVLLNKTGVPYIVDYDDAIFHQYDLHPNPLIRKILGNKIDFVMKNAALVTAGNGYLAKRARSAGAKNVEVIPTVVDLNHYNMKWKENNDIFTVGWIGAPSTVKYLDIVEPALDAFFMNKPHSSIQHNQLIQFHQTNQQIQHVKPVRLLIVGGGKIDLKGNPPVEVRPWTEETEVAYINEFDVGIMPLPDGPWERGKCGYKLIQYMACGVPVIASPIGVNKHIVKDEVNGFLASTTLEWVSALNKLYDYPHSGKKMGKQGRLEVENNYSLQVILPKLISLLKTVSGEKS